MKSGKCIEFPCKEFYNERNTSSQIGEKEK